MHFASREDSGHQLGAHLKEQGIIADVVLGLPRGGVLVGAGVAAVLGLPLEALAVRKIGHPLQREYAVGALAEHGVVLLHEERIGAGHSGQLLLEQIIREETERLRQYESTFHPDRGLVLAEKRVVLVDDGLATGSTMEAAVISARRQSAVLVVVAVPVSSVEAAARIAAVADQLVALCIDPDFRAVGCYYDDFPQVTDAEVIGVLRRGDSV